MLQKLVKHGVYSFIIRQASKITGVRPYYKVQYQLSMLSPRWILLRYLRIKRDGGRCVRCGSTKALQLHHPPRVKRNDPGFDGFLRELQGTVMLCDECHKD